MDTPTSTDIILLPGLFSIIGAIIYLLNWASGKSSAVLPRARWIGIAFVVVALGFGVSYVYRLKNGSVESTIYYQSLIGHGQVINAHYASVLGPVVLLLIVAVLDFRLRQICE